MNVQSPTPLLSHTTPASHPFWLVLHKLIALFTCLFALNSIAYADCCGGGSAPNCVCADGTTCGLTSCCGVGPCNIFCCNCDGGCRQPTPQGCTQNCETQYGVCESTCDLSCDEVGDCSMCYAACEVARGQCIQNCPTSTNAKPVSVPELEGLRRFSEVDTNHDGVISRTELRAYLEKRNAANTCPGQPGSADEIFDKHDTNKDGKITLDEVDKTAANRLAKKINLFLSTKSANASYYQKVLAAYKTGAK